MVAAMDVGGGGCRDNQMALGMRFLEGGEFAMGSERYYPEERPVRRVRVWFVFGSTKHP